MREYHPKCPLERLPRIDPLRYWRYPNLLRDETGKIFSDHITYIKSEEGTSHPLIKDFEEKVKKSDSNIELVYHNTSGNQWIFLLSSGIPGQRNLDQLQQVYETLVNSSN